ncbi:uncharacterized protein LOC124450846 [Xenia sp. Carnegie-2017]|uniref:uncharacterized protein LOC124450846 n=1 Tax=Xenia sp. Carnegie-2017 TaxID=2897299 RepID=UPI001F03FFB9|nr:uncharacterized protein LOC124450846 [Xenia sp. Carnegie-2017]XP_046857465.1 uncharacterized protein LOC124450846 [Xenia sp. Carnegie-2017]XP_046857466.1 uncharacterized protein LOC124450846 [Xenia sp. Carnegie-2017]
MRYTNVFCGRYSLRTGVKTMAWFYITLYFINCILNIASTDIAASYRENVNKDFEYSRIQLLIYHYICLTFGIVTIFLSIILLVKFTESEDFLHFTVKWNISRCFIALVAIVYVAVEMNHILTVSLSTIIIMIDLCASAYFTGVVASYIKELEHPIGQVAYTTHTGRRTACFSKEKRARSSDLRE